MAVWFTANVCVAGIAGLHRTFDGDLDDLRGLEAPVVRDDTPVRAAVLVLDPGDVQQAAAHQRRHRKFVTDALPPEVTALRSWLAMTWSLVTRSLLRCGQPNWMDS